MTGPAGLASGPFWLHARVPGDMVSLAVEDDEQAAARQPLRAGGASWLGLVAGPHAGRWVLLLISITVTPFDPPEGIDPAAVLAAMLRAGHPSGTAVIEEFRVPGGPAVGIRRAGTLDLRPTRLTTGIAQALIAFPAPAPAGSRGRHPRPFGVRMI